MNLQRCCKCGKELLQGSIKYILSIRLFADVDDTVSTCESTQKVDDIDYLINCLENLGQEEMEKDVHQEMVFLLCKDCRNNFCKNPLNKQKADPDDMMTFNGILH